MSEVTCQACEFRLRLIIVAILVAMVGCSDEKPSSPNVPIISLSPDSLAFNAAAGGPKPPTQKVAAVNAGVGTMTIKAVSLSKWITAEYSQGLDPDTVAVSVSTAAITAGTHVDSVQVTSPEAGNSPQFIKVTFSVFEAIGVSPRELIFSAHSGGENPETQYFQVFSHGGGTTAYSAGKSASWLSLTKTSGNVPDSVGAAVDIAGLSGGVYVDTITVIPLDAANDPVRLTVTLTVSSWLHSTISAAVDLQRLILLDNGVAWVVGFVGNTPVHMGAIFKSTDGGISWVHNLYQEGTEFGGIAFADDTTACVVGDNAVIIRTEDGGESWNQLTGLPVNDSVDLWTVAFIGPDTGWAVGTMGTIIRTIDGGITWQQQTSPTTLSLAAAAFVDNQKGWIVGNNGNILRTTDGGDSWELPPKVTQSDLWSIVFLDQSEGWVAGSGGVLLQTEDAGNSWESIDLGIDQLLQDITFVNMTHGWIVGYPGTILHTDDGGETWLPQFSETTDWLYGVRFMDTDTGLIVGQRGIVLRTTSGGY